MDGRRACYFLAVQTVRHFSLRGRFREYDLLAMRVRTYGRAYPFIELGLGIAFLSFWQPGITYAITILVFGFGLIGVFRALAAGKSLQCACVGRVFNLPLSSVAVFENSTMVVMSGDAGPDILALDDPATTDTDHVRQAKVRANICRVDPACRAETNVRQWRADCLEKRGAA